MMPEQVTITNAALARRWQEMDCAVLDAAVGRALGDTPRVEWRGYDADGHCCITSIHAITVGIWQAKAEGRSRKSFEQWQTYSRDLHLAWSAKERALALLGPKGRHILRDALRGVENKSAHEAAVFICLAILSGFKHRS